jgi:hypothetical protein
LGVVNVLALTCTISCTLTINFYWPQFPNLKMPFVPGYEEDGFLKGLNLKLTDIEPKADNCSKVYTFKLCPFNLYIYLYLYINIINVCERIFVITQIFVWHTQTKKNKAPLKANQTLYGSTNIWSLYQQIEQ